MIESSGSDDVQFNIAALDMLKRLGDGSLMGRMMDIFLKNAPERISAARTGVEANDRRAIELASHSLKSSSAQLGGAALQRASLSVEKMAATADFDTLTRGIDAMQAEFDLMRTWLNEVRAGAVHTGTNQPSEGA
jgi:HPt (histidine-containing phosphotransfer) domain-containing protein